MKLISLKNKIILWLGGICIALLAILILTMVFKKKVKPVVPVVLPNQSTSYLASQHIDTVYIEHYVDPKPSTPILVDTVEIPVPVLLPGDTAYVVLDYYTGKNYLYQYKDSVINWESTIFITQNKVFTINPKYSYKEKIITVTNDVVSIPKWSLAVGGGVSYNQTEADLFIEALLTHNRNMFGGYYGILRKEVGLSYKYIILYK